MNPKEDNNFETLLDGIMRYRESGKTAVVCGDAEITYRQLICDAVIIATALKGRGTGKGSFVILAMERSADMIKALLGILYAGAAYVAVDRTWPDERLQFIKKDCQASCTLDDALYASLYEEGRRFCGAEARTWAKRSRSFLQRIFREWRAPMRLRSIIPRAARASQRER